MSSNRLPQPRKDWALFLDIDGTLIEIAPRPELVVVPDGLPQMLREIARGLDGALALVSGRTLGDIDRLMTPVLFTCAAEHGGVVRFPDGHAEDGGDACALPDTLFKDIVAAARNWPGTFVERKRFAIAVHFRNSMSPQSEIGSTVCALAAEAGAGIKVIPARMAFELRRRGIDKGRAVRRLMAEPGFYARVPVYVGDDTTDEDGIRAATSLGGIGLRVRTAFDDDPARVRAWLDEVRLVLFG